jgi:hypothetical protein
VLKPANNAAPAPAGGTAAESVERRAGTKGNASQHSTGRTQCSFFDTIDQTWLIRFLEHRIGDKRIIRLIQKWLKAGVLEDGVVKTSAVGTAQGSVISPLLANIYLHHVLDLWVERWRRREATGCVIIVRYADDFIIGFEHEEEARRFLDELRQRMGKFSLTLHPEKTRLIEFGRHAATNHKARGLGRRTASPGLGLPCSWTSGFPGRPSFTPGPTSGSKFGLPSHNPR